jgi:hypothetical protein
MNIEKEFGNLSEFAGRDVELFRSSDRNETAKYFTTVEYENRESAEDYFELLRFGIEHGSHQIYIRYPGTDHFIEMEGGGFGSGRGDMKQSSGENIWEREHHKQFKIYSHNNDLILLMGRMDWTPEFNFMRRVARYDKGNPFNSNYPNETFVNHEEIEKALSRKYIKIPESVRKVEYCYKTKDEVPKYFLIDYPAYNFDYKNHRFYVIEHLLSAKVIKEYEIKQFVRYRDGGTTIITVVDDSGEVHQFFSPTSLGGKELVEKWDDIELVEASKAERNKLIKLLGLNVIK